MLIYKCAIRNAQCAIAPDSVEVAKPIPPRKAIIIWCAGNTLLFMLTTARDY